MAFLLLSVVDGVTFPDMCIETLFECDTATVIQVGSYQGDLNGWVHGAVATLETEYGCNVEYFKSFDELVQYIKGVAAEQSKSVAAEQSKSVVE